MLSKKQRDTVFQDDGMFHEEYSNYDARRNQTNNAQNNENSMTDERDIDADQSESYQDSTDSSTEDNTSANSDQFEYRVKNKKHQQKKNETEDSISITDDDDALLFDAQYDHKTDNDDIFGLRCFLLICLFFAAIIISMLFGIRSKTSIIPHTKIEINNTSLNTSIVTNDTDLNGALDVASKATLNAQICPKSTLQHQSQNCLTDFGNDYKINIVHTFNDLSMECIQDEHIFKPIYFMYGPYDNNENYMQCLRINMPHFDIVKKDDNRELWLRDYDINNKNMHSLRIEFIMLFMDVEQGFDNVFLSWQYNDVYSSNYVHWTGNDTAFQSQPGIQSSKRLFWNVLSDDYIEICLNLKSDANIKGNGFKGVFSIKHELGIWGNWSQCFTATSSKPYRWGAQCGIGVRHKTKICQKHIDDANSICIDNETSLNQFCTKKKCEYFNNSDTSLVPLDQRPHKLGAADLEWKWNGRHRVDPVYPDPFQYILASNTQIDINFMITQIQSKMKQIASRYSDERILTYGIGKNINNYNTLEQRIEARLLQSLLLGHRFVVSFTGSSNTAGHDNMFMSSYSMQLQSILRTFWAFIGYNGASFHVHNVAEGGHLGTKKLGWCMHQLVPQDSDFVFWESMMNDAGDKQNYQIFERWLRNVLSLPKKPLWGVINTGAAADRYGDKCNDKPYCKIGDAVNMGWWRKIRPMYEDTSDMLFVARRGCYALGDKVPECTGLDVTWHPSPNGHRLFAETFAYWFLSVALKGLKREKNKIETLIKETNGIPNTELECLLRDPKSKELDSDPKYCGASCKESNWCTTSYMPMDESKRMHNLIVNDGNGSWISSSNEKSKMGPLIWRKGGQASIDDKVEWMTEIIGSELIVRVNVISCCIVIFKPVSGGDINKWLSQFKFSVNDDVVDCKFEGSVNGWLWKDLGGCIIQTQKGKHDFKIKYVNKTLNIASIDMIATF